MFGNTSSGKHGNLLTDGLPENMWDPNNAVEISKQNAYE